MHLTGQQLCEYTMDARPEALLLGSWAYEGDSASILFIG